MNPKLEYILLDTCSFLNALNHRNDVFNYDEIRELTAPQGTKIVISPYTLYELIQGANRFEDIETLRNQLIQFGDFYVRNQKEILEHRFLEYGVDFIFMFSFDRPENYISFADKRAKLRDKVYESLFKRVIAIAELIATIFLILDFFCCNGNSETIGDDVKWKVNYINKQFLDTHGSRYKLLYSRFYKHAGLPSYDPISKMFYRDFNAKDKTKDIILEWIIEILAIADIELSLAKHEWEYEIGEYNLRIVDRCRYYLKTITTETLTKTNNKCRRITKNEITAETIFEHFMSNISEGIQKDYYRSVVKKTFNNRGFGDINNDLIDMMNLELIQGFPVERTVYITEEKKWSEYMLSSSNPIFNRTKEFYKQFMQN